MSFHLTSLVLSCFINLANFIIKMCAFEVFFSMNYFRLIQNCVIHNKIEKSCNDDTFVKNKYDDKYTYCEFAYFLM